MAAKRIFLAAGAMLLMLLIGLWLVFYYFLGPTLGPIPKSSHYGSVAYADNGRDTSRLKAFCGPNICGVDNHAVVCDNQYDGREAVIRLWENGTVWGYVRDTNGIGGGCGEQVFNRNFSSHDTCAGWWDGYGHGCGELSRHGT